jgi:streptogramin lyase
MKYIGVALAVVSMTAVGASSASAVSITQHPYPTPAPPYDRSPLVSDPAGVIVESQTAGVAFDRFAGGKFTPGPAGPSASVLAESASGSIFYIGSTQGGGPPGLYEVTGGGAALRSTYAKASAAPISMAVDPENTVWLLDESASAIDRYVPGTGEFDQYPTEHDPVGLALAPERSLWVTQAWPAVSRFSLIRDKPQDLESQFVQPSGPLGIVTGPDAAGWFTEGLAGEIGRIAPTGGLQQFQIPNPTGARDGATAAPDPSHITVGPDGALYFTDPGDDSIGRITTAGEVSEFPIPPVPTSMQITKGSADAVPDLIVSAPGGELVFTEDGANALGSLNLAGTTPPPTPVTTGATLLRRRASLCVRPARRHSAKRHCISHRRG